MHGGTPTEYAFIYGEVVVMKGSIRRDAASVLI